jgi:hypothetical protein
LLEALDRGYILYKTYEVDTEKQFFFKTRYGYEIKGWCSDLVNERDCIFEIIKYPDNWKIFPKFNMNRDSYPYPWSTKWKTKYIKYFNKQKLKNTWI